MKKGQEYEAVITAYEFPNKGIAYIEERKITIKRAFLGQRVRIRITKTKNGKAEGRLLEVLQLSDLETAIPVCSHFGQCGGCSYQTLPYEAQLAIKEQQVRELLDEVCDTYIWDGILGSPVTEGYRNKMEFSFGDEYKDGPLALGLHKRGSFYDLVTVKDCKIVDSDYNQILAGTLEHFAALEIPFFQKMRHEGCLRHLVIRQTARSKDILINLVVSSQIRQDKDLEDNRNDGASVNGAALNGQEENKRTANGEAGQGQEADGDVTNTSSDIESIKEYLKIDMWVQRLTALELHGRIAGVLLTVNDSLADVVQSDATYLLYGQDYIYEEILGLKFRITPFSFFQTNSLGAEVLYEKARDYVGDTRDQVIFDLYSGTGTIAQMLAPVAKKVVGVEIVEEAVASARENAVLNQLDNCEFIAGDVLKVLDRLNELPDMIVLDPPRDGVHPKALNKIIRYGVERMVYISCKPTSLARDLVTLQTAGYRVEKVCCVDMFPETANVETVVLLYHQEVNNYVHVDFEPGNADYLKRFKGSATYAEIKAWVLEHYGFQVSSLYVAQVKRKCGLEVGENYNKAKSDDNKVPVCPKEKEDAIMEAFRYFRMI